MSYDKLSFASFQENIKAGKYESPAGARRAVGKAASLSEADKEKARKLIDAHFGTDSGGTKKVSKPRKTSARRAKSPVKQQINVAPKRRGRPKASAAATQAPVSEVQLQALTSFDMDDLGSVNAQIRIAEKTIASVGSALSIVAAAKQQNPEAELGPFVEEMTGTLAGAVGIFRQVVNSIATGGQSAPKGRQPKAQPAPAPVPAPIVQTGTSLPTRAESMFRDSQPSEQAQAAAGG